MNTQDLDTAIAACIDRLYSLPKGSPEFAEARRELAELCLAADELEQVNG